LFANLLATFGALLGVKDGDVGRRLLTTAWHCLPAAWGRVMLNHLVAGGVLGSDAAQLLSSVPKNVFRFLEG
jgi:hypothetical protein